MQNHLRAFVPNEPVQIPQGILTVQQVIDAFLAYSSKCSDPRTLAERRRILALFCQSLGGRPVTEARPVDLVLWLNGHPEWQSDWTILRVINTVQRPFHWAEKLQIISRNPFYGVTHSTGEAGRALELREFRLLLRNTDACFRRVLIFLRYSGCRPGEMAKLQKDHVDRERGFATLWKHKTLRTRRERKPRVIILHPILLKLIAWIDRHQPCSQHLFLNARGKPWKRYALAGRIKRLRKKCHLPKDCRLYGLRHLFGTEMVLKTGDLKTTAVLMGHSNTRTTEHYAHVEGQIAHLQAALIKGLE